MYYLLFCLRWRFGMLFVAGLIAFNVNADDCNLRGVSNITLANNPVITLNTLANPDSTAPIKIGEIPYPNLQSQVQYDCQATGGTTGADWYGWRLDNSQTQGEKYSCKGYTYERSYWPTNTPGIYYSIRVIYNTDLTALGFGYFYLPQSTNEVRMCDVNPDSVHEAFQPMIEIWQRGQVTNVQSNTHPAQNGYISKLRAGNAGSGTLSIGVNSNTFTVILTTPTCNLSVSPTTIDFGDVGNDKPRKTFTLKNSNCVNASGVTLKLTSTKAAYDNSGLSILANTTTGTSAAGGRGVAVSYEGSSRKYLSANDTNSSVSIDFGSIVTAKDITMAGLLTCTSASNNSTCDDYTPGAFTAAGTISATYK